MGISTFALLDPSKQWRDYENVRGFTKYLSWNFEADRRRHQAEREAGKHVVKEAKSDEKGLQQ
jgi:hypothetical protein